MRRLSLSLSLAKKKKAGCKLSIVRQLSSAYFNYIYVYKRTICKLERYAVRKNKTLSSSKKDGLSEGEMTFFIFWLQEKKKKKKKKKKALFNRTLGTSISGLCNIVAIVFGLSSR